VYFAKGEYMNQLDTPKEQPNVPAIALPPDRIMRLRAVVARTGLSRSSIYRAIAAGKFPRHFHLPPTGYAVGWSEREINSFLEQLQANNVRSDVTMEAK
jgi:prophage regulatory protein